MEYDEIFLIYDDGTVAEGFPFVATNKIRSAPSILNYNDSKYILACSTDGIIYCIKQDGTLKFSFNADNDIYTSPSFLDTNQGLMIFFGSDSGTLYAIDINGEIFSGFPIGLEQGFVFHFRNL